jgi:hypothetical protein
MNLGDLFASCLKTICSVLTVCYGILYSLSPDTFQGMEEFICRLVGSLVQVWVRNLGQFYHEISRLGDFIHFEICSWER